MEEHIKMLTAIIVLLVLVIVLLIKSIYIYNKIMDAQKKSEKAMHDYIALQLKSKYKRRLK